MSEAVKRYSVFIGFEHGEQQMILASDHDRIVTELQARVDQLAAKRDSLREALATAIAQRDHAEMCGDDHVRIGEKLIAERDTLRAEVEQLRKDAERLDKLQSLAWYRHGFEDDAGVDGLDTLLIDAQGDVRAAIDAALEASR